jgi:hypothetical protein
VLEGDLDGERVHLEITVLDERELVTVVNAEGIPLTIEARVVQEREFQGGELCAVARLLVCPLSVDDPHLVSRRAPTRSSPAAGSRRDLSC